MEDNSQRLGGQAEGEWEACEAVTEVEDVSQMSGGILGGLRKGDFGGPVALTHVELLLIIILK